MLRFISIIVVSLVLTLCLACSGGYSTKIINKPPLAKKKEKETGNELVSGAWGGFTIPPDVRAKWSEWLKKYNKDQLLLEEMNNNGTAIDDTDGPGSSWPYSWKGSGIGNLGFPPMEIPPWGYNFKNTGLPTFCYTPPDTGHCIGWEYTKSSTRWSYNPYLEDCQAFQYSGCGGNNNNFESQLKCVQACSTPLPKGCDDDFDAPMLREQFIDDEIPSEFKNRKRRCGNDPNV